MDDVERLAAWRGPDPERVDAARVVLGADSLMARGTSCAPEHALAYRLVTGPAWVTRELDVVCLGRDGETRLELRRDDAGRWAARRWVDGSPVGVELPDLEEAVDCDLALCPLTNTMPVLRSGLLAATPLGGRTERFVMAWVDVPSLLVHASVQDYGPARPREGGAVAVRFGADGDSTTIEFDADGLVESYPGIAERVKGR